MSHILSTIVSIYISSVDFGNLLYINKDMDAQYLSIFFWDQCYGHGKTLGIVKYSKKMF